MYEYTCMKLGGISATQSTSLLIKKSQRLTGYVRRPANVTVAPREGVLLSSCLCFHYVGVSVGDTVKSCIAKPVDAP